MSWIDDAVWFIRKDQRAQRINAAARARKDQVISEKRAGYWAVVSDAIRASGSRWNVELGGQLGPMQVRDEAGGLRCNVISGPTVVRVNPGEDGLTIAVQDGRAESRTTLIYDLDDREEMVVRSGHRILEVDDVVGRALEPIVFPNGRYPELR
ncbi:MAG TPA: hypothetical protein VI756_03290 [Blastocatellia bacterium]